MLGLDLHRGSLYSSQKQIIAWLLPLQALVGLPGIEPGTSRLSGVRSNHLSYRPTFARSGELVRNRFMPPRAREPLGLHA
jgi:hypothetical protein